jgi:hypothetical protein
MTEQFILGYVPQRIKELGYNKYTLRYRDLVLDGNSKIDLSAYNELYFIIDQPLGVVVESDYGLFDSSDTMLEDNVHQHRGEILISNPGTVKRRIKLIQVIIVN